MLFTECLDYNIDGPLIQFHGTIVVRSFLQNQALNIYYSLHHNYLTVENFGHFNVTRSKGFLKS